MSEVDYSNLHGLIIGINKYKSPQRADLDGCVSDATSILNYFVEILGVPRGQILTLFNEQATRDGIINAFWTHLIYNQNIKPSNPIVIYYAGHGDTQPAPVGLYSSDGQWEFILPHDASTFNPIDGSYIYGIPDRTIGALIYELYKQKGDNITIIMDSCFSGSGTRRSSRSRQSHDPNAPPIPPTLDRDILNKPPLTVQTQALSLKKGRLLAVPSLETHVLLAACQNHEQAQEVQNMDPVTKEELDPPVTGLFTSSLLRALRSCNPAVTSYSEIMRIVVNDIYREASRSTSLTIQVPQCEGKKKDRILFQTRFAMSKGMIALMPTSRNSVFRIKAGSASGIQVGTELGVYSGTMSGSSAPLAKLVAVEVTATLTTLSVPEKGMVPEIPQNAYVVVTKYNSQGVRILVEDEAKLPPIWKEVFDNLRSLPIEVVLSKPGEPSDLVLVPADDGVKLQRQDPSLIQLEPKDIVFRHTLGLEELTRSLTAIVQFHFHLQRRNPDSPLKGQVDMQLIGLKSQIHPILRFEEYVPLNIRTNLFGDSLVTGAVAELTADPEKRYGLVLTNRSNWPLYAYVLYFDLEDYSIGCLYEPPSRSASAPLSNNGRELPVGFGSSGTDPLRVESSTGAKKETGLFMLFVTSAWVDISHIEQPSPFDGEHRDLRQGPDSVVKPEGDTWDVVLVPVSINQ